MANLARDCVRPPVPMSWFLPHAGLPLATAHFQSQQLGYGTHYRPVSPLRRPSLHSGDSWKHFCSRDNCVNNTDYCVAVLKCLALSTTLIVAQLNWTDGLFVLKVPINPNQPIWWLSEPRYVRVKDTARLVDVSTLWMLLVQCARALLTAEKDVMEMFARWVLWPKI